MRGRKNHEEDTSVSRCWSCRRYSRRRTWNHIRCRSRCGTSHSDRAIEETCVGVDGKELVVFVADLPPGAVAGRHSHPGDEAIYMLQGALRFEPEGGQPFDLKAGEIAFHSAKHVDNATNMSASVPAKLLNCMLAEEGQPLV